MKTMMLGAVAVVALLSGCAGSGSNSGTSSANETAAAAPTSFAVEGSINYTLSTKKLGITLSLPVKNNLTGSFQAAENGAITGGSLKICDSLISVACYTFNVDDGHFDSANNVVDVTGHRDAPGGVTVTTTCHLDNNAGTATVDSADGNVEKDSDGNALYTMHLDATTAVSIKGPATPASSTATASN